MTTNALSIGDGMSIMERAISASKSTIVPELYQRNPDNCVIAINLADAMGLNVLTVMQYLYIVHKKPAWAAVFAISRWNTCGKFSAIRYELSGTPGQPKSSCVAISTDLATGEELRGTVINWEMVVGEEWTKNSKWRNMPEQMFRYRSASFLIKTYAPELLMGLPFADEREDAEVSQKPKGRKPLAELRNVESEVIDTLPAVEQKPIAEKALQVFTKCMTALDRAEKREHLEWVEAQPDADIVNAWTKEQVITFDTRLAAAWKKIEPETPKQSYEQCLLDVAPMSLEEAQAHIKNNVNTDGWDMQWSLDMDKVLEGKAK